MEESGFDIRGIVAVVDRRAKKSRNLGDYGFVALVDFVELAKEPDAQESQQVSTQETG
jgi:orotate phosphoribosyltransferase